MKRIYLLFTLILLIPSTIIFAQSPYTNVQIRSSSSYGEVSIEINPKNTDQLVGGCNIDLVFYSNNGGFNWTNGIITDSLWRVWGDPVLVADTVGHFYYFHLSNTPSSNGGYWIDRIVCQKSTNAGITWSNSGSYTYFNPPKEQDKQWAAVDFTHGARGNWIYCTWTQFDNYGTSNPLDSSNILFARSTNAGSNWVGVARINKLAGNCVDGDYTVEGAVPCVGPNGEVYVAWAGPLSLNNFRIFFDKSTDGGNSWLSNDIIVASQPGGWDFDIAGINRSNGLPFTVCDYSNGPYRGTIYVNWTDSVSPGDHDVRIAKSTNGGLNWSAPIRVNNDAPGKEQFLTAMTVDQVTGHVYVVFYDRRNYSDNQTDVFLARSTNGGTTFVNERISASPFIPSSFAFFGDYIDIAAHNGKIRPVWQRLQSGVLSVWTAIIDFPVKVENTGGVMPKEFSLGQNFPNPFNPSTSIKFEIPLTPHSPLEGGQGGVMVTLKIYDLLGKEVASLVNEQLSPGTYEVEWNASNQPSGLYFYKLRAGEFTDTRKMILVK